MPIPESDVTMRSRIITALHPAAVYSICGMDNAGFGHTDHHDKERLELRSKLYRVLRESWNKAGFPGPRRSAQRTGVDATTGAADSSAGPPA